jgi:succinate dehydrogenase hydrophobic anchor subunit
MAWMPLTEHAPIGLREATEGNERLTALTAVALIVLLAVEGVTIVWLRPFLAVHLFVGLVLIPPVALKLASTGYRFARYYTHNRAYRRKGPPPALLRWTAPGVVVTTLVVLVTGVWLLVAGPRSRDAVLPFHKIGFIVWLMLMSLHVLGHVAALPRVAVAEYASPASGRGWRGFAVTLALAAGVAMAVALVPHFHAWQAAHVFHHRH